jgi:L-ribulokinase
MYNIYRKLHDAFGTRDWHGQLDDVMKRLLEMRDRRED